MADIRPKNLVIKCVGHRQRDGKYFGICLDFDLAAQADSLEELKVNMQDMIQSYIEVVLDTDDQTSVPELLSRRAPLKYWVIYHFLGLFHSIRQFKSNFAFNQHLPFCLSRSNC